MTIIDGKITSVEHSIDPATGVLTTAFKLGKTPMLKAGDTLHWSMTISYPFDETDAGDDFDEGVKLGQAARP